MAKKWVVIFLIGLWFTANAKDESRAPAAVPTSNGVVCGQGRSVNEAEEQLNNKLGTDRSELIMSMVHRYGKMKNPRTTGVSVQVVPPENASATTVFVVCVSLSGDQT